MKRIKISISVLFVILILMGCYGDDTVDWYESFRFTGTVEEIRTEDNMLVMKEYNAPESRKKGNIYEIPADEIQSYETGDKLLVIVETNTQEDIWDLEHMRFVIKPIEN
ncbi:hypothetical protein [Salimicrobium halophilum]|uniref:DUF3221 domain-containing protein n=1 Tax=Salimicrobium halophilum TaxID=86666 RepID=A0A1G8QW79_9BACI|nr:hypothetical protein [Salimicrobium halophilum]SDJ08958.1 hypothetical protein SAMN04490247_0667 [Salimicrobium halophilum]